MSFGIPNFVEKPNTYSLNEQIMAFNRIKKIIGK